jgi:hypothetical protein
MPVSQKRRLQRGNLGAQKREKSAEPDGKKVLGTKPIILLENNTGCLGGIEKNFPPILELSLMC